MKLQCFMPVFNEADILPHTLRHLYEQDVSVHVIDGWSTDGSWEIVDGAQKECSRRVTCERFPASGPDPIQNCTAILNRIEDLAAASDADWILYSDADEWRRSNLVGYTLSQHIEMFVDPKGYSAIDFRVFQFYCTGGDGWENRKLFGDIGPEEVFNFYDEADCISRIPNRKLWKNVGRVALAGGGHEVTFPCMRIYPPRFVMKHYPFRTPSQARAKVATRLARRCKEEHDKGWGVHYDQYAPDFDFRWDPSNLKFWPDTRSPLP